MLPLNLLALASVSAFAGSLAAPDANDVSFLQHSLEVQSQAEPGPGGGGSEDKKAGSAAAGTFTNAGPKEPEAKEGGDSGNGNVATETDADTFTDAGPEFCPACEECLKKQDHEEQNHPCFELCGDCDACHDACVYEGTDVNDDCDSTCRDECVTCDTCWNEQVPETVTETGSKATETGATGTVAEVKTESGTTETVKTESKTTETVSGTAFLYARKRGLKKADPGPDPCKASCEPCRKKQEGAAAGTETSATGGRGATESATEKAGTQPKGDATRMMRMEGFMNKECTGESVQDQYVHLDKCMAYAADKAFIYTCDGSTLSMTEYEDWRCNSTKQKGDATQPTSCMGGTKATCESGLTATFTAYDNDKCKLGGTQAKTSPPPIVWTVGACEFQRVSKKTNDVIAIKRVLGGPSADAVMTEYRYKKKNCTGEATATSFGQQEDGTDDSGKKKFKQLRCFPSTKKPGIWYEMD
jgi:hypothetical protein